MSKPPVIFDLDGTLVDTAPDLIIALNHILEQDGCRPAPEAEIRRIISEGSRAMMRHGLALAGETRTETELADMVTRFVDHYSENIAVTSRPFPGLVEVLDRLTENGHPLGVCTNKRELLSRKLLEELKLDHYFGAIVGIDTLPVHKPDPEHLLGTIRAMNASPEGAVMVGDSETDIRTAQGADIYVAALDIGYSPVHVSQFQPSAIFSDYREFFGVLPPAFSQT